MEKGRKIRTRKSRVVETRPAADPNFEPAQFLNIDLDVKSRYSLAPLIAAWPWAQRPLQNNRWLVFSAHGGGDTAESTAQDLIELVGALSPAARRCWNRASSRTFDVGVRASMDGRAFEGVQLSAKTLSRIASIGARLQITVYRPERVGE